MKNGKSLSIKKQIFYQFGVGGMAWCIAGIASYASNANIRLIGSTLLLIGVLLSSWSVFYGNKEMNDEMSDYNLSKAKSVGFTAMQILILLISAGISVCMVVFNLRIDSAVSLYRIVLPSIYLVYGMQSICVCTAFIRYEKNDSDYIED